MKRADNTIRVEVNITRHYGQVSVSLGASLWVVADSADAVTAAYDETVDRVIELHRHELARIKSHVSIGSAPEKATGDTDAETWDVEKIVVDLEKGKKYYRLMGGPFTQWGVRLWLDRSIVGEVDYDFKDLEPGEYPPPFPMRFSIAGTVEKPGKVKKVYNA